MSKHVIIIAEAGVNHNGDFDLACRMIQEAKNAGVDYVKFQTAVPRLVISRYAPKAEYQKETTGGGESQLEMCERIHLRLDAYRHLASICRETGIGFMSTPFDIVSIDTLATLNMDYWKIPSGEITNLPYLRKIAEYADKVILSTGMSTLGEVDTAVDVLTSSGRLKREDIALLHCTTQYPTPYNQVNLQAMNTLKALGCGAIGYSDHTPGIVVPIAAVAMGASIIEKHFTLDKNMEGPDHRASLNPGELKSMVASIRAVEDAIGSPIKCVAEAEQDNIAVARKSIVASRPIKKGESFSTENLTVKRPGNGVSPMLWDMVMGIPASRDFMEDEPISL